MTEDNRKEQDKQEKKEELTEKDLDKASGGSPRSVEDARHIDDGIHHHR